MLRLATPAIFAQVVNALYNIVDRIYIGNMPEIGHLAITGVGLTFPLITVIGAFAALVGAGGGPLLGMALGEKDDKKAHKILGTSFSYLILLSIILTVVMFFVKEPFLHLFNPGVETFNYANDYFTVYLFGTVLVSISLGLNPCINAQGFSKIAMASTVIGAVLNIILDPVFIFWLNMGVRGAAVATIISQAVSAAWILWFLFSKKATVRIKMKYAKLDLSFVKNITGLGISPFIMQATNSLMVIAMNYQLAKYGDDFYVGAMTIISSISTFVFLPTQGLGTGAQPIISYNYGAQNYDRVRKAFKFQLALSMGYSTAIWLALELFPQAFIVIFNSDPTLVDIAVPGLRIQMAGIFAMGAQSACQQSFVALGQAKVSAFLALLRKVFLMIPLAFILPIFIGVDGVFYSEPIADILSASTCSILFWLYYKKNLLGKEKTNSEEK